MILITYHTMHITWSIYFHQGGDTPLIYAASNGHTEVVKFLVDAGAYIEAKDNVSKRVFISTYVHVCMYVCVCAFVRQGVFIHHAPPPPCPSSKDTHTHTHPYVHLNILLLILSFTSVEAPASTSSLTTPEWPLLVVKISRVQPFWWKYSS